MPIKKSFVVFFCVLMTSGVLAQVDPDPNGLGIYFDENATLVSMTVEEGTETVTAYLILTNPSVEGNLIHWAAGISSYLDTPGNAAITGFNVHGHNLAINMPGSANWIFEVSVNDDPPFPTTENTILAEIMIWPMVYDVPINLYVTLGYESGGYGTDNGGAEFHPSSGDWNLPVAVINGQAPVATESYTLSRVKSLYR